MVIYYYLLQQHFSINNQLILQSSAHHYKSKGSNKNNVLFVTRPTIKVRRALTTMYSVKMVWLSTTKYVLSINHPISARLNYHPPQLPWYGWDPLLRQQWWCGFQQLFMYIALSSNSSSIHRPPLSNVSMGCNIYRIYSINHEMDSNSHIYPPNYYFSPPILAVWLPLANSRSSL